MTDEWIDATAIKARLSTFFEQKRRDLTRFGSTINQTFEAYVFAQVVSVYRAKQGWLVQLVHPRDELTGKETLRLKFSTRGRPANYSYARCVSPEGAVFQVRHQLRVSTRAYNYKKQPYPRANICLDVAVIRDRDLRSYKTDMHVNNDDLVTFGEAKHMSAFAELVASFVGIVHELQPERLKRIRLKKAIPSEHPAPFLFVSGKLWATAEGVWKTIERRRYDIDIYWRANVLSASVPLPTRPAVRAQAKAVYPYRTLKLTWPSVAALLRGHAA
jgi:hypothetical protein